MKSQAVFALFVCMGLSLCWAQAPGDEETRCTVQHSSPPTYPDTERNLMDSYNYEDLVPGNGTGSIIATAVWNDYSFDGNDVDGIIAPTYWQQIAGGLCRFQARVCGWRQNRVIVPQDNWLFTQHIRQDFDSTTYDYNVTIHVYASYSGPNCRERNGCRQRFNLLRYFTNDSQLPSTEGSGYMNRENYQRFAQPTTLVTISMNTYSFTLPPSSTGFYIAVQDIGSCLTLLRLRVYRNNCKSRQVGLVQYPSAPSPTQPANIFTTCVANADHVGSKNVTCTSVGTWGPDNPVCQCRLGYEDRETECVACSAGEYRSSRDSVCQRCPDENTIMTELAAPECRCRTGYFRNNESDTDTRRFENPRDETPDFGCTKPLGPPERVSLTPLRTGMTVSWSPPTDDGGRTDNYYYVEISDPDNLGSYTGGQYLSRTSRSRSFSGLRRCTQYCVRVTAHNGVSDQDPDRVNTRTVEVCEETLRDRPDKVTGVQGTQPYVVWSPTPCSDSYRITFTKSGGTIRRNVASEYYIVRSSDIPEGSGVLRVTVAAFNEAGFGAESDTLQLSSDGPINPTPTTTTTTTTETSVSTTTETSIRTVTRTSTTTSTPPPVTTTSISTRTVTSTRPASTTTIRSTVTSTTSTPCPTPRPPTPASPPTAVQDGPTSIRVSWTPSSDATGYMIHYTSSRGDSGSEDVSRGHSDSYTLTGLVKEDTYTISIRATSQVFSSSPITVEVTLRVCQPSCVNGICNETTRQCDCSPGYTGVSCDERVCQPSCVNGVCNGTTGQCDCTPRYTGVACDERVCQPSCVNEICNGTIGQCVCSPGYTGISCDERVCQPSCVNGVCNGTSGHCVCSPGYTGVSCDEILPLMVRFINDSPRVLGDSVEADILISRPVQSLICRLKAGSFITEQDCSSGHVVFSGLSPAVYTLRVVARDSHNIKAFVKNHFEIIDDPGRCTLHLINEGVSVRGDSVRVEFTGRGPASDYLCHLDRTQPYQCSSPVEVSGLSPGKHVLKVVPTGCGRNRINLKTTITIE